MISPLVCVVGVMAVVEGSFSADDAVTAALSRSSALTAEAHEGAADAIDDSRLRLDALRLRLEHRNIDQFVEPRLSNGVPNGPLDNVYVGLAAQPPGLDELVIAQTGDTRQHAATQRIEVLRRALGVEVRLRHARLAGLSDEERLAKQAAALAAQRRDLVGRQLAQAQATRADAEDAQITQAERAADAAEIEAEVLGLRDWFRRRTGLSGEPHDERESLCQGAVEDEDALVARAIQQSAELRALGLEAGTLATEELAWWLGFSPWISRAELSFINRPAAERDDVRFGVDVGLPIFRIFDGRGAALSRRRQALAAAQGAATEALREQVSAARTGWQQAYGLTQSLAAPNESPTTGDPDVDLRLAERRVRLVRLRSRAVTRCAEAAITLRSIVAEKP